MPADRDNDQQRCRRIQECIDNTIYFSWSSVFSHPDCHCRRWNFTISILQLQDSRTFTADREFHPAPKTPSLYVNYCKINRKVTASMLRAGEIVRPAWGRHCPSSQLRAWAQGKATVGTDQ